MNQTELPLPARVSIGIPTYNRGATLGRAINSALAQDYTNVEVLVSDNASTDGTEALCLEFSAQHGNFRYLRQAQNRGMTENFLQVLSQASGEYFMWLSDDDWLDENYVSACMRELISNPRIAQACGMPFIHQDGQDIDESAEVFAVLQDDGNARVLSYYRNVTRNAILYGVARRETLRRANMLNLLGGDFVHSAAVAFHGGLKSVQATRFHRSLGGTSRTTAQVVRVFGLHPWHAWLPNLSMCLSSTLDILKNDATYGQLSTPRRMVLATRVFMLLVWKRIIAGHAKTHIVKILVALIGHQRYRKLRESARRK